MSGHSSDGDHDQITNELGILICKHCARITGTIPTNGFKKIYVVCGNEKCASGDAEDIHNEQ